MQQTLKPLGIQFLQLGDPDGLDAGVGLAAGKQVRELTQFCAAKEGDAEVLFAGAESADFFRPLKHSTFHLMDSVRSGSQR